MFKIRSLLGLLALCVATGIVWMVFASRGSATIADGPNLSVRSDVLGSQWVVRDENIPAEACSAIEGEVTPALRTLRARQSRHRPGLACREARVLHARH